jgi:uncharacterized membrane protein
MTALIIGLVIFLGVHSVRVFAEPWRDTLRARLGAKGYQGLYTAASLVGFVLIVWGFGQARAQPLALWPPMSWARHLAALLMLVSFILLAAAYVPRNSIKAKLHHPMTLGVKVWAFAHLLANNTLAELLLFGGFLVWSVLVFRAARARDAAAATVYPPGTTRGTAIAVAAGVVAWALFAFWAHGWLIGVQPF